MLRALVFMGAALLAGQAVAQPMDWNRLLQRSSIASGVTSGAAPLGPGREARLIAVDDLVMTRSELLQPIVLPMYDGLPIAGYTGPSPALGNRQYNRQHAFERWLDLLALASHPGDLDDPALALLAAQSYASPAQWDTYFLCSAAPCHAADAAPVSSLATIKGWQGASELERRETHSRFADAYRGILSAQAGALPLDMYMTMPVRLGTYSAEHGGMPLEWQAQISQHAEHQPPNAMASPSLQLIRGLPLTSRHIAGTHAALPVLLACGANECERYSSRLSQRTAHAVFRIRLLRFAAASAPHRARRPLVELVGPIVLHADQQLSSPFHAFAMRNMLPPPAMAADAPAVAGQALPPFNAETLRLLLLKHHPDGPALVNFDTGILVRRTMDADLYDLALDGKWPAGERWGPFFPKVWLAGEPISPQMTEAYRQWSLARAGEPLDRMMLQFSLEPGSSDAHSQGAGRLPILGARARASYGDIHGTPLRLSARLPSRGAANVADEAMRDALERAGIAPADSILLVQSGLGADSSTLSDYVALVFPQALAEYTLTAASADPARISYTQMDAAIQSVSFVPGPADQTMVVRIEPLQARLYAGARLVANASLAGHATELVGADQPTTQTSAAYPAQSVHANTAPAETAAEPADAEPAASHDIVGLQLGMSMQQAQRIAREHLEPDLVYSMRAMEPIRGYENGRLFVSTSRFETIALLSADGEALSAVDRRLTLPPGTGATEVLPLLVEKFGQPQEHAPWRWWSRTPDTLCLNGARQRADLVLLEGSEPQPQASRDLSNKTALFKQHALEISIAAEALQASASLLADCHPILEAYLQAGKSATDTVELRFLMYDHGAYSRARAEAHARAAETQASSTGSMRLRIKM